MVPLAICGGWLAWKLAYYGALLPNSYHAKVEGVRGLARQGMRFRADLRPSVCVLPSRWRAFLVGGWLAWERRLDRRVVAVLAMPLLLWLAYVVRVGGDFMEYRFLVPVLPLAFLATYWVMCDARRAARARRAAHVNRHRGRHLGISLAGRAKARRLAAAAGRTRRESRPGMVSKSARFSAKRSRIPSSPRSRWYPRA